MLSEQGECDILGKYQHLEFVIVLLKIYAGSNAQLHPFSGLLDDLVESTELS